MYIYQLCSCLRNRDYNLLCGNPIQLHIHGMLYILQALPSNQRIRFGLQSSISESIRHKVFPDSSSNVLMRGFSYVQGEDLKQLLVIVH